jgi:uncharacterized protein YwqG
MHIDLPEQLEKYRNDIEKALKYSLKIKALDKKPKLWESKLGGKPYLPKGFEYPVSKTSGKALKLIAQINYEEIPHFEPFPRQGILQIYISDEKTSGRITSERKLVLNEDGHFWGMCDKNKTDQRNFRVIYHAKVLKDEDALITDFSFLPNFDIGPVFYEEEGEEEIEYPIGFEEHLEIMSKTDCPFIDCKAFASDLYKYEKEPGEKITLAFEEVDGDKIGGYHSSSNMIDDRKFYFGDEKTVLLLQMDGCGVYPFSWGDGGRAQFFITEKDLKKLDFSKVLYSWDCT